MDSNHVVPDQIKKKATNKLVLWRNVLGTLTFLLCFASLLMCLVSFTDMSLTLARYRYALFFLSFVMGIIWWITKGKMVNSLDNEDEDVDNFIIRSDKNDS